MIEFFKDLRAFWHKHGWHIMLVIIGLIFVILFIINHLQNQHNASSITLNDITEYIINALFRPAVHNTTYRRRRQLQQMSKGESQCKEFAEFYFQLPFQKQRPDFLKNPITGENLELDLYNESLNLAIEYNGAQHYQFNSFMHKNSRDRFQNQQYRDLIKRDMCEKSGVKLIIVPYTISNDKISDFLFQEFKRLGYEPSSSSIK